MPNAPEILITGRDRFSDITRKAREELRQMSVEGRALGGSLTTSGQVGGEAMGHLGSEVHKAREAGQLLSEMIGVRLPRAISGFVASSALIGPALSAAFSGVAVIGLIDVLSRIPAAFDKITGSITGWDEKAQKAYENQISLNRTYLDLIEKVKNAQIDLAVKTGTITAGAGTQEKIKATEESLKAVNAQLLEYSRMQNIRDAFSSQGIRGTANQLGIPREAVTAALKLPADQLANSLKETQAQAEKLKQTLIELKQITLPSTLQEDAAKFKESIKAAAAEAEKIQKILAKPAVLLGGKDWETYLANMSTALITELKLKSDLAAIEIERLNQLDRENKFWDEQLNKFRIQPNVAVEQANKGLDEITKGIIKQGEEMDKLQKKFIDSFREGAGRVWDDFFQRGTGVLSSIANVVKGLLNTVGRSLFQDFATSLLAGPTSAISGVVRGVFGGGARSVGGGVASSALGIGAGAGLGAGVGGLTWAGAAGGWTGVGVGGSVSGALGLGGGAGLLGLGAATIPVIGAIAAAAAFGLMALFSHRPDAPFTRDPHDVERNRTVFFFTGLAEAMDRFTGGVDNFVTKVQSVQPGDVVMAGLPTTLQNNTFRRNTAAVLMDDI